MRYLLYILLWVIPICSPSQPLITESQLTDAQLSNEPIVVEFWADWNDQNKCHFLGNLNDCRTYRICIVDNPDLADYFEISVLPTIIVFNKKEEIVRYKGNLLFQLDVDKQEIQAVVDSIIISKFR
tara:strand:+ start:2690 stop:3067 length:378 start_codon:yes stop_codon:yes gene_type:complete